MNFLRLIIDKVDIRLYDGDTIFVRKSDDLMRDQLLAASRTNLSPDFIEVFVSGRSKNRASTASQGASLNQAIAGAGGPKLIRGRVEFLRFTQRELQTVGYSITTPKQFQGTIAICLDARGCSKSK